MPPLPGPLLQRRRGSSAPALSCSARSPVVRINWPTIHPPGILLLRLNIIAYFRRRIRPGALLTAFFLSRIAMQAEGTKESRFGFLGPEIFPIDNGITQL